LGPSAYVAADADAFAWANLHASILFISKPAQNFFSLVQAKKAKKWHKCQSNLLLE